jgi:hypothetical protein
MEKNFSSVYLICLERGDDINYVVGRNSSLKKARQMAQTAKKRFPNDSVYITIEKSVAEDFEDEEFLTSKRTSKCSCGYGAGECVSRLSCPCNAIAICRQMNMDNDPYQLIINNAASENLDAEVELQIISIKRGMVEVLIPDWRPNETVILTPEEIPSHIMKDLEPGVVLSADINLDSPSVDGLVIRNLDLAYEEEDEPEEELSSSQIPYYSLGWENLTQRELDQDEEYMLDEDNEFALDVDDDDDDEIESVDLSSEDFDENGEQN